MKYLILLIILSGCSFQQLNINESKLTISSVNYINTPKDLKYLINDALLVKPESNTNLIIRDYKENLRDFSGGNNLSNIESQIYGEVTLEINVDDAKNFIIISGSKKFQNNFLNPQAQKIMIQTMRKELFRDLSSKIQMVLLRDAARIPSI